MSNLTIIAMFLLGVGLGGLLGLSLMKRSFDDYVEVSEKRFEDMNKTHKEYEELLLNRIAYLDELLETKDK